MKLSNVLPLTFLTISSLFFFPSVAVKADTPTTPQVPIPPALVKPDSELSKSNYLGTWHSQNDVTMPATSETPSTVTYDVSSLNAHFKVSPAVIAKCMADASRFVEKNTGEDKLIEPYYRTPAGVRGSHGKAHESGVWLIDMDGTPFTVEGYHASHLYQKPDVPESWTKSGAYSHALRFIVNLVDLPKIGTTIFDKDRLANASAVTVEKFILTDDANHAIQPIPEIGIVNKGVITTYDTFRSLGNKDRSAFLPYYSDNYVVAFPLFDPANGKAYVGTGCKKIKLHIITQSGEQAVEYELK